MKNVIVKILAGVMCLVFVVCVSANMPITSVDIEDGEYDDKFTPASNEAVEAADALYSLGLFNGTGVDANGSPIYELERTPNRHEAVTMLVRLLGMEETAKGMLWTAPFTDVVDWAKPYVMYAYENGITLGTSSTTYGGSADTTATQYITFMLRTLGYSSETDFKWDAAWELSDEIGMTNGEYNSSTASFTRGDMVQIAFSALSCEMVDGTVLLDYLTEQGSINHNSDTPPENENKLPDEYTWNAPDAFDNLPGQTIIPSNKPEDESKVTYPWGNGGKLPNEYTWEEFEGLTQNQQDAFVEWFASEDDFYAWIEYADNLQENPHEANKGTYPWENGGKLPSEYTWAEFEALSEDAADAFSNWFDNSQDFLAWMNNAMSNE